MADILLLLLFGVDIDGFIDNTLLLDGVLFIPLPLRFGAGAVNDATGADVDGAAVVVAVTAAAVVDDDADSVGGVVADARLSARIASL